ncbi:hypothetical protein MUK72_15165 (plasmid) [Halococcus dombrowskii]|uniref:Integral membrane protein n=1 Tax=Halococcus dombrowskii TaxID=179637 RepID=A0AAV3SC79_HALDO|nr:hypothetical protein [Halococcus dombrowskii]UOO96859.1 hypothetical protein MUK72_15165 [Halococcus dombrowskii]
MNGADQSSGVEAQLWSRPQHAVAYQEARAVLNAQQQRQANLDDKALRTARLTTVIVSALITVIEAFNVSVVQPMGYIGIVLLVVSFGVGLAVYSVSAPILGPNADGVEELVETDEGWEEIFLSQLEAAISTNTDRLDRSSSLLLISDVSLFVGVILTLAAIAI